MTKAPLGVRRPVGTHRRVKGVKRSLVTNAYGVPLGLASSGVNRHDMEPGRETLEDIVVEPRCRRKSDRRECVWTKGMTIKK